MTKLHELYHEQGQSPWLDDLHREWLTGGHLHHRLDQGVRGVTSNPTILAKAIEATDVYDDQLSSLIDEGRSIDEAYWEMVVKDIEDALEILRPVYDESAGADGFVSLEVAPSLARDTDGSVAAARSLHRRIDRPNLLVKVPGTAEGVPAVRQLISEGHSINVTLIFSIQRYDEVMEAYLGGLEDHLAAGATDLSGVRSVASSFVSRVDTEVDRRLERLAGDAEEGAAQHRQLLQARGGAAVAQAQQAYQRFAATFSGPRWEYLAGKGATPQRLLWASTSTKNPEYPDTLYVDELVGPDTVVMRPAVAYSLVARTITQRVGGLRLSHARPFLEAAAQAMGIGRLRVIETGMSPHRSSGTEGARRAGAQAPGAQWAGAQWDDAGNLLVLRPGTVVSYERNTLTNARLEEEGIEVIRVPGSELAGCRGGPRAMCCPVGREPASMPDDATHAALSGGGGASLAFGRRVAVGFQPWSSMSQVGLRAVTRS